MYPWLKLGPPKAGSGASASSSSSAPAQEPSGARVIDVKHAAPDKKLSPPGLIRLDSRTAPSARASASSSAGVQQTATAAALRQAMMPGGVEIKDDVDSDKSSASSPAAASKQKTKRKRGRSDLAAGSSSSEGRKRGEKRPVIRVRTESNVKQTGQAIHALDSQFLLRTMKWDEAILPCRISIAYATISVVRKHVVLTIKSEYRSRNHKMDEYNVTTRWHVEDVGIVDQLSSKDIKKQATMVDGSSVTVNLAGGLSKDPPESKASVKECRDSATVSFAGLNLPTNHMEFGANDTVTYGFNIVGKVSINGINLVRFCDIKFFLDCRKTDAGIFYTKIGHRVPVNYEKLPLLVSKLQMEETQNVELFVQPMPSVIELSYEAIDDHKVEEDMLSHVNPEPADHAVRAAIAKAEAEAQKKAAMSAPPRAKASSSSSLPAASLDKVCPKETEPCQKVQQTAAEQSADGSASSSADLSSDDVLDFEQDEAYDYDEEEDDDDESGDESESLSATKEQDTRRRPEKIPAKTEKFLGVHPDDKELFEKDVLTKVYADLNGDSVSDEDEDEDDGTPIPPPESKSS